MKKIILASCIIAILILSFICIKFIQKESHATYIIGILQTASHPALNAARDGFIEELKNKLGENIEFIIKNAQGSISQAHSIAQQFHAHKKFNAFFAIATPAAQALSSLEKERPIFIAAVTDPHALGLIYPHTNISGSKDMIDVKTIIEMLKEFIPSAETVGLIYTAGEINSITLIKRMHSILKEQKLHYIDFAINNEADIQAAIESACIKTDVILAPTDNTIASTISLITAIANKYKKPLIVSDNMLVQYGALMSRGIDYKMSGKQAAEIALKVLVDGKHPADFPIEQAKTTHIYVNKETLNRLGLTIPESLKNNVILI